MIHEQPLCRSIETKSYTKTCLRKGCGNVFKTAAFNAIYCGDESCRLEVSRLNNKKHQGKRGSKTKELTKGVKIRKEAAGISGAQKWLSMPLRK